MSRPEFKWVKVNYQSWSCYVYGDLYVGRVYYGYCAVEKSWFVVPHFASVYRDGYLDGYNFTTRLEAQAKLEELFIEHEVNEVVRALAAAGAEVRDPGPDWVGAFDRWCRAVRGSDLVDEEGRLLGFFGLGGKK